VVKQEEITKLGPVHLMMVQLDSERLHGAIAEELRKASESEAIRLLDALALRREPDGTFTTLEATELTEKQHEELGAVIGTLLGLGAGGEVGAEEGAKMGAKRFAEHSFGLSREDMRAIAQEVPAGKTLLIVLFEHRWALHLKEAADEANGKVLAEGIIRPESLVIAGAARADT
jgi:uncharacterized membrane protein